MMSNFCFDSAPESIRTGHDRASNCLNMDKNISYFPVAICVSHPAVATSFIPLTSQLQKLFVRFKSKKGEENTDPWKLITSTTGEQACAREQVDWADAQKLIACFYVLEECSQALAGRGFAWLCPQPHRRAALGRHCVCINPAADLPDKAWPFLVMASPGRKQKTSNKEKWCIFGVLSPIISVLSFEKNQKDPKWDYLPKWIVDLCHINVAVVFLPVSREQLTRSNKTSSYFLLLLFEIIVSDDWADLVVYGP